MSGVSVRLSFRAYRKILAYFIIFFISAILFQNCSNADFNLVTRQNTNAPQQEEGASSPTPTPFPVAPEPPTDNRERLSIKCLDACQTGQILNTQRSALLAALNPDGHTLNYSKFSWFELFVHVNSFHRFRINSGAVLDYTKVTCYLDSVLVPCADGVITINPPQDVVIAKIEVKILTALSEFKQNLYFFNSEFYDVVELKNMATTCSDCLHVKVKGNKIFEAGITKDQMHLWGFDQSINIIDGKNFCLLYSDKTKRCNLINTSNAVLLIKGSNIGGGASDSDAEHGVHMYLGAHSTTLWISSSLWARTVNIEPGATLILSGSGILNFEYKLIDQFENDLDCPYAQGGKCPDGLELIGP